MSNIAEAITEGRAIQVLLSSRWRRNFCLPTYTPPGWFECDCFELTKAGYFREYEVKLSRADFVADRRKRNAGRWMHIGQTRVEIAGDRKHDLLASRSPMGPTRFWYVAPEGVIDQADLPEWAGLIELFWHGRDRQWLTERKVVPAPVLHREKCAAKVEAHARGICYWRMHELRGNLPAFRSEVEVIPTVWGQVGEDGVMECSNRP